MASLEFTAPELFTLIEALDEFRRKWVTYGPDFVEDVDGLLERLEEAHGNG